MKLKEAIEVLQKYQSVAGDNAEFQCDTLRLESVLHIEYYSSSYGYSDSDRTEKSRSVTYVIVPIPVQPQATPRCDYGLQVII